MLKLQPNPTFKVTVGISVPGQKTQAPLDVEFRHKTKEQLISFSSALTDGRTDQDILSEIIEGWKGLDEEYSPSSLRDLLSNYPTSGLEILRAYLAELTEARTKNSVR